MPSDANIYSMLQQPKTQGPMELAGQAMQIRGLMDQGQLNNLQRQQLERGMAEEDAVRQAFSGMQPGQTIGDILPNVMKVAPKAGVALQKTVTDQQKAQADLEKTRLESHGLEMKQLRDDLASVSNDSQLQRYVQRMHSLSGGKGQYDGPTSVSDPNFQTWRQQSLMTADKMIVGAEAQMADTRAREEGALNRGVTTRGQDMTDARTREAAAKSGKHYDADRGMVIDTENNTAAPVTQSGEPLAPKLGDKSKSEVQGLDAQSNTIKRALQYVKETPNAFGMLRGAATAAGSLPEAIAMRASPTDHNQARAFVYNVVSKVINERAGAAQSKQELARLRGFLPSEYDDARVIKDKLEGFESYLAEQRSAFSTPVSSTPAASAPKPPTAKGGGKIKFLGME